LFDQAGFGFAGRDAQQTGADLTVGLDTMADGTIHLKNLLTAMGVSLQGQDILDVRVSRLEMANAHERSHNNQGHKHHHTEEALQTHIGIWQFFF
jgi:hypothetical protein